MSQDYKRVNVLKYLLFMITGSYLALAIVLYFIGFEYYREGLVGLSAPLWVGVYSMARVYNIYETNPNQLTAHMTKAFFGKMLFYALLIVLIVRFSAFITVPFVSIFTGSFIALLIVEAAFLRSLFKNGT